MAGTARRRKAEAPKYEILATLAPGEIEPPALRNRADQSQNSKIHVAGRTGRHTINRLRKQTRIEVEERANGGGSRHQTTITINTRSQYTPLGPMDVLVMLAI